MSDRVMWAFGLIALVILALGLILARISARRRAERSRSQRIDVRIKD